MKIGAVGAKFAERIGAGIAVRDFGKRIDIVNSFSLVLRCCHPIDRAERDYPSVCSSGDLWITTLSGGLPGKKSDGSGKRGFCPSEGGRRQAAGRAAGQSEPATVVRT